MIRAQRRMGDHRSTFVRYYLSSLPADAHQFAQAARAHWLIENQLHWSLDVTFREDANRTRTDFAPQNLAIVRHIALNLLQQERSTKDSLKVKRLRATWVNIIFSSFFLFRCVCLEGKPYSSFVPASLHRIIRAL